MKNNRFAVITGTSKGIGFEYARQLLALGYNVIGVSRNNQTFADLKKEFPNQHVVSFNYDLSDLNNVQTFYDNIKDQDIDLLINNAGFGDFGSFIDSKSEVCMNMIDLNIKALQLLTRLFVKHFQAQNYGKIINISSIVGFIPFPFHNIYGATKAYVNSFSIGLNYELKFINSSVRVVTVCPGATVSSFAERAARVKTHNNSQRKYMPTAKLVKNSLKVFFKHPNKDVIIVGLKNKYLVFRWRHLSIARNMRSRFKLIKKRSKKSNA